MERGLNTCHYFFCGFLTSLIIKIVEAAAGFSLVVYLFVCLFNNIFCGWLGFGDLGVYCKGLRFGVLVGALGLSVGF